MTSSQVETTEHIPYSLPFISERTLPEVTKALGENRAMHGDGPSTIEATSILARLFNSNVSIVHSCTAALEMAVMLAGCASGDEVIVPDFTFTSTANAVALRGAVPVFVDVDAQDLNLSVEAVRRAVTSQTRAIIVVHYGGVPAKIHELAELAEERGLILIEDAAQAIGVSIDGKQLGTWGDYGAISFHATKNIQSGEGGVLICRDRRKADLAEMMREKGTNRREFFRGEVDKYTWTTIGSSYLPADIVSAYLVPQLREIERVNAGRVNLWRYYKSNLEDWARDNDVSIIAKDSGPSGNGHIFALVFREGSLARDFTEHMRDGGVSVSGHYQALHSTPAGLKFGRRSGSCSNSKMAADGLVRLPTHEMAQSQRERIVQRVQLFKTSI